jgi:FkbM family methyltransferase
MPLARKMIQRAVRRFGYDIRQSQPRIFDFILSRNVDLVLDVGANNGGFARELLDAGYAGRIISFEPVSDTFRALSNAAASNKNWTVFNTAIGELSGTLKINVSQNRYLSSFKETTVLGKHQKFGSKTERTEEVGVLTIDSILKSDKASAPFLKSDTQGFEREVLEGAKNSLTRLAGILIEVPLAKIYHTWTFSECAAYMEERGFIPAQFHRVYPHPDDPLSWLEADILFRPQR